MPERASGRSPISTAELQSRFANGLTLLNGPNNTGLNFILLCALFLFQGYGMGATVSQMEGIVLSSTADAARRTKFRQAKSVARIWAQNELPKQIRLAHSTEAALSAARAWCLSNGVTGQDNVHLLWYRPLGPMDGNELCGQLRRNVDSTLGSICNYENHDGWNGGHSAAEFAGALMARLSDCSAHGFLAAVIGAYRERFGVIDIPVADTIKGDTPCL